MRKVTVGYLLATSLCAISIASWADANQEPLEAGKVQSHIEAQEQIINQKLQAGEINQEQANQLIKRDRELGAKLNRDVAATADSKADLTPAAEARFDNALRENNRALELDARKDGHQQPAVE